MWRVRGLEEERRGAPGERCGRRERGRSGGRDSRVRLGVRGEARQPCWGLQGCAGRGLGWERSSGCSLASRPCRLVGTEGLGGDSAALRGGGEAVQFRGSLPGLLRGVPIVSHSRSWFRLLWRR